MMFLKQSTAGQTVILGPFVDSTDGNTQETGLTIANTDIKLSKNGGTIASKASGGGTHDANGWYAATLDATDTNTVGRLQLYVHVAGALAVVAEYQVLEEAIYDALFGASATGLLPANVTQFGGSNLTSASGIPEVKLSNVAHGGAAATLTAASIAVTNSSGSAVTLTSSGGNGNGLLIQGNGSGRGIIATGGSTASGARFVGGSTSQPGMEILSQAGNHPGLAVYGQGTGAGFQITGGATGHGMKIVGGSTSGDAINCSVTSGTQATFLAAMFSEDTGTTYASAVAGSVVKETADNAGGSSLTESGIADAVWDELLSGHAVSGSTGEALSSAGSGASASTIADAVLDEAMSGHTTSGTLGKAIADILVDTAEIGTAGAGLSNVPWNTSWDAEVQSECTDALNAYDPPTNTEMEARTIASASYATASALATVDGNVDSILTDTGTTLPALIGTPAGASVSADIAAVKSDTSATLTDTGTTLDGKIDSIKTKTDSLTFTVSNQVDANVQGVNDVTLTGDGAATPWGPA